ncbi:MAG: SsrA-binding protein SmpB [Halothiobacillaceae bacterium]|jgi:SsrA-binding protein|nr:SsrA-binding protein SmpB [Halothiobacillaceae bacterium]MDY0049267.1 SsrA-binding protein SmpB [Halothiobacillaceae bacterium]
MAKNTANDGQSTIALNKKARHDYFIEDRFEAGISLEGWEVKSLRAGKTQIADSHVIVRNGEVWWLGGLITPLLSASTHIHPDPTRTRRLLLNREEINRLIGAVERKGYTIIPTALYWKRGRAKLEIGLAKGKKDYDKRATEKERDWQRDKARLMRKSV